MAEEIDITPVEEQPHEAPQRRGVARRLFIGGGIAAVAVSATELIGDRIEQEGYEAGYEAGRQDYETRARAEIARVRAEFEARLDEAASAATRARKTDRRAWEHSQFINRNLGGGPEEVIFRGTVYVDSIPEGEGYGPLELTNPVMLVGVGRFRSGDGPWVPSVDEESQYGTFVTHRSVSLLSPNRGEVRLVPSNADEPYQFATLAAGPNGVTGTTASGEVIPVGLSKQL